MNTYHTPPLPFAGNKRNFLSEVKPLLQGLPQNFNVVDLFGGSGLLSHNAKRLRPDLNVIYNDFDNYRGRLDNIRVTNEILKLIHEAVTAPKSKKLSECDRARVIAILERYDEQDIDFQTLASNLCFSGKQLTTLERFKTNVLYNRLTSENYSCSGYLDELTVTHCDYRDLTRRFKDDETLYLVDPPYLATASKHYKLGEFTLGDHLYVLELLKKPYFIFFTSDKSGTVEFLHALKELHGIDLLAGVTIKQRTQTVNRHGKYEDYILYRLPDNE